LDILSTAPEFLVTPLALGRLMPPGESIHTILVHVTFARADTRAVFARPIMCQHDVV